MNKRKILSVLGRILLTEAGLMLPSLLIALIYGDGDAIYFLATIAVTALVGVLLTRIKSHDAKLSSRDGYTLVAYSWIIISLIGAVPLYLTGEFRSIFAAIFEMVSGFTTTGASVLAMPENLPHGVLFWRSFSHWIGGMGVLVFVLMIIPMKNDNSMHLIRAEMPGPTAGKLVPRMKRTSMILYGIYAAMTFLLAVLLLCGGLDIFDSLCLAFGTAGTGGFALSASGIAGYNSAYVEVVLSIFMLLFGINFNVYYLLLLRRFKDALKSEEMRVFLIVVFLATAGITVNIATNIANTATSLREAFFQVTSIVSTTGYATVDFNFWPEFSKHTLVLLMVMGGCAGSTAGGLKVSRVIMLVKSFFAEIRYIVNPKSVQVVRLEYKYVDTATLNSTRTYAATYLLLICFSTLFLSLDSLNLTTNLTAVLSCLNNIGPGLDLVGPMANFGVYSDLMLFFLSILMLIGRLEIFPMFLLFSRSAHDK